MKLIVPMAGRGTRLRPHTHVTPKPLLPVAVRTMVERIVETFAGALPRGFEEAVFVLGPDFGDGVRAQLTEIAGRFGIRASFAVQETARGTAHAVAMAADALHGEIVIVFADTLFEMGTPDLDADAVVWTMTVEDPSRFGVAVHDAAGRITEFVEKPATPISREAIVGIYYVRDGASLRREIDYLLDNDVTGIGGEYQLTDALDRMLKAGLTFKTASVDAWLDCGTIPALMETSALVLAADGQNAKLGTVADDAVIIEPVFIGEGATVAGSVVGPNVSVEAGATVTGSVVRDSIVFGHATVEGSTLRDSLVGHHATVRGACGTLNIGDHATAGV